jgi:A/G-specific adenine glycosylase
LKKTPVRVLEQIPEAATHIDDEKVKLFQQEIKRWYGLHGRHFPWREPGLSSFHIVLAELLLQRTRAESVAGVYPGLLERLTDWADIQRADVQRLAELLEPLGLTRSRVGTLKALATVMVKRRGEFPATRYELEELPGIGQYMASAVLVTLYGAQEPLLDTNMARVLERYFGPRRRVDIRDDPYLQGLARKILPATSALEFNWAILDFAARTCKLRNPLCEQCPLATNCDWLLHCQSISAEG